MGSVSFRCPTCRRSLADTPDGTGLECDQRHRFDRAREGYVHLMPSGRATRRMVGDTAEQLAARRRLLDRGRYDPIIAAVVRTVTELRPAHVLDAGCGEGTYLAAIVAASGAAGWGTDISKAAVRLAARRHPHLTWAVASTFDLPFDDGVLDVAVTAFAPRRFDELRRIVRPGGSLVIASPGADHLREIASPIDPRQLRPHVSGEGFEPPTSVERVHERLDLTEQADIDDLLTMTPLAVRVEHAPPAPLTVTLDVWVTTHTVRSP